MGRCDGGNRLVLLLGDSRVRRRGTTSGSRATIFSKLSSPKGVLSISVSAAGGGVLGRGENDIALVAVPVRDGDRFDAEDEDLIAGTRRRRPDQRSMSGRRRNQQPAAPMPPAPSATAAGRARGVSFDRAFSIGCSAWCSKSRDSMSSRAEPQRRSGPRPADRAGPAGGKRVEEERVGEGLIGAAGGGGGP
jgi:hypothetical protein